MQRTGHGDKDEGGCSRNQCVAHRANDDQASATSNQRPTSNLVIQVKQVPLLHLEHRSSQSIVSSECKWCA